MAKPATKKSIKPIFSIHPEQSGSWVGFIIDFLFQLRGNLSVNCSGSKRGVAQYYLDRFEIHSIFQPVSGNRVADGVGSDVSRNSASFDKLVKIAIN